MIETRKSILFLCISFIPLLIIGVSSKVYLNDKTTIAIEYTEGIVKNKDFLGGSVGCVDDISGERKVKETWLEEPPVFHLIASGLYWVTPDLWFVKITPLIATFFSILGLMLLADKSIFNRHPKEAILLFIFFLSVPIIFIHSARFIPDVLAFCFAIWSFYFIREQKYIPAYIFALLAVTTKALVIFVFFYYFIGYVFFTKDKKFSTRFLIGTLMGTTIIPMLLWIYFIYINQYDSPYFPVGTSPNFSKHTGGVNFDILLTSRFWGRYLNFSIARGMGYISLLIFLYILFSKKKELFNNWFDRSMIIAGILQPTYWLIIRAQTSEPWKTYPVIIPIIYLASKYLLTLSPKKRAILVCLNILMSITMIKYSFDQNIISSFDLPEPFGCTYFK